MSINAATSTPHIGYGLVSEFISSDADLNIFRRFLALNARNILYLQSELMELEARLEQLDEEANDRTRGNDVWAQPRSWRAIKKKGGEYWETVERMSTCSEKYCESGFCTCRDLETMHSQNFVSCKHPQLEPLKLV
jgi:hypothetical protein